MSRSPYTRKYFLFAPFSSERMFHQTTIHTHTLKRVGAMCRKIRHIEPRHWVYAGNHFSRLIVEMRTTPFFIPTSKIDQLTDKNNGGERTRYKEISQFWGLSSLCNVFLVSLLLPLSFHAALLSISKHS